MDNLDGLWETWLDKVACVGIVVILGSMVLMLYTHEPEATAHGVASLSPASKGIAAQIHQRTPAIQAALDKSKSLLESKDYSQLAATAAEIIKQDPKESFAYVYLARAYVGQNELPKSLINYATAVKLNPDFVDKKSPDKIGPELKALVRSALIETRKEEYNKLPDARKSVKALYYLQRRLAGGCE